jgi:tetratricopeptide (TPR) repeat protein
MSDITRHELKQNELEQFILRGIEWVKENRNTVFSALAVIAGAALLTIFLFTRFNALKTRTSDKLTMAQGQLYSGQINEGVKLLDELINQYSLSASTEKARMLKADYLRSQKKYDEAEKMILPVIEKPIPKEVGPLALSMLAIIKEDSGKYADAIKVLNSFISLYPEHFLAPRIYESLARNYELTGATEEAKKAYQNIVTLYPSSGWTQRAQERLATLSIPAAKMPSK